MWSALPFCSPSFQFFQPSLHKMVTFSPHYLPFPAPRLVHALSILLCFLHIPALLGVKASCPSPVAGNALPVSDTLSHCGSHHHIPSVMSPVPCTHPSTISLIPKGPRTSGAPDTGTGSRSDGNHIGLRCRTTPGSSSLLEKTGVCFRHPPSSSEDESSESFQILNATTTGLGPEGTWQRRETVSWQIRSVCSQLYVSRVDAQELKFPGTQFPTKS